MKKIKNFKVDFSKVSGGTVENNPITKTYKFKDSFDGIDEKGNEYSGDVNTTTTLTSYNLSETTVKKGGPLSEFMKKMNKGKI